MMRRTTCLLAAATALLLSACVVAPYPYARGGYANEGYDAPIAVANVPPPAPYVEAIPVVPFVGALWISGYWGWNGGRHQWVGGHYERPRPGYNWVPHRWEPVSGAWHLRAGGWVRR